MSNDFALLQQRIARFLVSEICWLQERMGEMRLAADNVGGGAHYWYCQRVSEIAEEMGMLQVQADCIRDGSLQAICATLDTLIPSHTPDRWERAFDMLARAAAGFSGSPLWRPTPRIMAHRDMRTLRQQLCSSA